MGWERVLRACLVAWLVAYFEGVPKGEKLCLLPLYQETGMLMTLAGKVDIVWNMIDAYSIRKRLGS